MGEYMAWNLAIARAAAGVIVGAGLLAGCAEFPLLEQAPLEKVSAPASFTKQTMPGSRMGDEQLAHWWKAWRDPVLDRLVERAIEVNYDIKAAQAHVKEARAFTVIAEIGPFPNHRCRRRLFPRSGRLELA